MAITHAVRSAPPATVVDFKGEIDMSNSPEVRKILRGLVKDKVKFVVLNLKAVEYIDSSGIATLLDCLKEMRKYKGTLRLAAVRDVIMDVFRLARLEGIFEIFPDESAAIAAPVK